MRPLLFLASLCCTAACVISRPEFLEPKWGDAPPPVPSEITEITWDLRTCRTTCAYDRVTLRRGATSWRKFLTAKREDSAFTATVDSAAFAALAAELVRRRFFRGRDGDGAHVPLATRSLVISAATLCRRRAASIELPGSTSIVGPQPYTAIDSVIHTIAWTRCCWID